jgi:hypothetical protein
LAAKVQLETPLDNIQVARQDMERAVINPPDSGIVAVAKATSSITIKGGGQAHLGDVCIEQLGVP